MSLGLVIIWAAFFIVNAVWQIALSVAFKAGMLDTLQMESGDLYKMVVERSAEKNVRLEDSYRHFATAGLNLFALPLACLLSFGVVLISYI